ncbi:AraC family transcriptional regulator [Thalassotalea nanhaiensis]|uniref:AraC family transcriptional regulator n=1 Tax=Thalassotalea nanhaiensis TaxID=3065648 RepID=A0ABY9TEZ6_9GAMM|nr:AraC family transcriptional regulator [Colwelliaceae bacterium SQ345]
MHYNFYVVRTSYLETIIIALDNLNADTDKLLTNVGLSRRHIANPNNLMLELPAWVLLENAAAELAISNLGAIIGMQFCEAFFKSTDNVKKQFPLIEDALKYFIDQENEITNGPSFWLKEDTDHIWLCRTGTPGINIGVWQMEQYVVSFLIGLLKHYLGANWQPKQIKLKLADKNLLNNAFGENNCKFEFANRYTAIAIEKRFINKVSTHTLSKIEGNSKQRIPKKPNLLISKLLEQNYFGANPNAESISDCCLINLRKLQRILHRCDSDLTTLLEQDKKNKAQQLVLETAKPIAEISAILGYNDKANFTRAFKRWFKVPPTTYRKTH